MGNISNRPVANRKETGNIKKRYTIRAVACLTIGIVLVAAYVCCGIGLLAGVIPVATAALCIGLWALFVRLVLCRMPHLLEKGFTQPILWALSMPAFLGIFCLLMTLPVSFEQAQETAAVSILFLEAVFLLPAGAVAALVLGILAVVKAARHFARGGGTRAYNEVPFAVSIIALFATLACLGLAIWSILC